MATKDDRDGILLSVTIHVVVLLLLAVGLAVPPEVLDKDWPPQLMEIEFGPAPTLPVQTGPPEAAEAGESSDAMEQPEPERPTPPAPSRARVPERTPTPPRQTERPIPRPVQSDNARPSRPNPPSRATEPEARPTPPQQTTPTRGTGQTQGESATSGTNNGPGTGSGGDAPVEVGFQFGNRSYDCPVPPFGGIQGEVTHRITFAPNGRYVAERPVTRNAALNDAVQGVVSRCRAEALPSNATQVNQSVNVTFRFRAVN